MPAPQATPLELNLMDRRKAGVRLGLKRLFPQSGKASLKRKELEESRKQLSCEREWIDLQNRERECLVKQLAAAQQVNEKSEAGNSALSARLTALEARSIWAKQQGKTRAAADAQVINKLHERVIKTTSAHSGEVGRLERALTLQQQQQDAFAEGFRQDVLSQLAQHTAAAEAQRAQQAAAAQAQQAQHAEFKSALASQVLQTTLSLRSTIQAQQAQHADLTIALHSQVTQAITSLESTFEVQQTQQAQRADAQAAAVQVLAAELRAAREAANVSASQQAQRAEAQAASMQLLTSELSAAREAANASAAQHAQRAEAQAAAVQLLTDELSAAREAASASAAQSASLQSALQAQLAELKLTNEIQHEQLVGVRADLCAVCAQLEASKSLPAAVAKRLQALGLRTVTVVERQVTEAAADGANGKKSGHGKIKQRALQHWDSASEEFGSTHSPRIGTKVAELTPIPEQPAATADTLAATAVDSPTIADTTAATAVDSPAIASTALCQDGNRQVADYALVSEHPSEVSDDTTRAIADLSTSSSPLAEMSNPTSAIAEVADNQPSTAAEVPDNSLGAVVEMSNASNTFSELSHNPSRAVAGDASSAGTASVHVSAAPAAQHAGAQTPIPAATAEQAAATAGDMPATAEQGAATAEHLAATAEPAAINYSDTVAADDRVEVLPDDSLPAGNHSTPAVASHSSTAASSIQNPVTQPTGISLDDANLIAKDGSDQGLLPRTSGTAAAAVLPATKPAEPSEIVTPTSATGNAVNSAAAAAAAAAQPAAATQPAAAAAATRSAGVEVHNQPVQSGMVNIGSFSSSAAGVAYPAVGIPQHQNQRAYMEDEYDVCSFVADGSQVHLYAVFDGHNGVAAAHCVSLLMEYHVKEALQQGHDWPGALTKAMELAEEDLWQRHQQILERPNPWRTEGGTTALVAVLHEGNLHVANVGDCRAVLGRWREDELAHAVAVTTDHKPEVERSQGASRLQAEHLFFGDDGAAYLSREGSQGQGSGGVEVQPLGVSRSLGDFELIRLKKVTEVSEGRVHSDGPLISTPELFQHSLGSADELLILASDGLGDVVTSQAAINYARRHLLQPCATPKTCAAALVQHGMALGTTDNITVIVVQLSELHRAAENSGGRPARLRFFSARQ